MRSQSFPRRPGQQGYVMMALMLTVALVLIALSAELPAISAELRRQREQELIHRGSQYTRAIGNYYRRFGMYPNTLEQLESSNDMRFLRRRYKDPMTGGDFLLLHEANVHLNIRRLNVASAPDSASNDAGDGTAAKPASDSGQAPADTPTADNVPKVSPSPFASLMPQGSATAAFGGGPMVGVASSSGRQSFHVFDGKNHYKDWQFVYSPILDTGALFNTPFDGIPQFSNAHPQQSVVSPGVPLSMQPGAGSNP